MAGRRKQPQAQRNGAYVPLPSEGAHRYAAAAFYGGGARDDRQEDVTSVGRDLAKMVRERTEMARLVQAQRAADEIIDPPQGGDSVSAETMRVAGELLTGVAQVARADATDARTAAKDAAARVDTAFQNGVAAASASAEKARAAEQSVAQMALAMVERNAQLTKDAVTQAATAQVEGVRAAAAAQVEAANSKSAFFEALATRLIGAAPTTPTAAPPQDPLTQLVGLADAFGKLQGIFGPKPGESADGYEKRLMADVRAELARAKISGEAEQTKIIGTFLQEHGGTLANGLFGLLARLRSAAGAASAAAAGAADAVPSGLAAAVDAAGAVTP